MSKEMMQSSKRKPGIVFFLALIGITVLLMLLAAQPAEAETNRIRLAGKNRYETSFAIAENLYKTHGKYANMTVASGANYPDALSSCYLTYEKDTPLLLVDKSVETQVLQRIKKYTKPGGTVYLIGGTGSVSAAFEQRVKAAGFKPVRLAGTDRYKTNLAILKAVGTNGKELLVASGMNYPDSLSASAVPKPLLLVGEKLTEEQKAFLRSSGITKFYILGGFGTIPITVQSELRACCGCPFERLGGENRYETSFKIAKKFFHNPPIMTLACGTNFPDGLSGGPLAMNKQAPLVLVNDLNYLFALRCGLDFRSETVYTFGGAGSIPDETVDLVMYRDLLSVDWLKRGVRSYHYVNQVEDILVESFYAIKGNYGSTEVLRFTNTGDRDLILSLEREHRDENLNLSSYNSKSPHPDFYAPLYIPAGQSALAFYTMSTGVSTGVAYTKTIITIKEADEATKKLYSTLTVETIPEDSPKGVSYYLRTVGDDSKRAGRGYRYLFLTAFMDKNGYILYLDDDGGKWEEGGGRFLSPTDEVHFKTWESCLILKKQE